jgi:hypothetical protein
LVWYIPVSKIEELISKIKILKITWLPLSYNIIIEQLESLITKPTEWQ